MNDFESITPFTQNESNLKTSSGNKKRICSIIQSKLKTHNTQNNDTQNLRIKLRGKK